MANLDDQIRLAAFDWLKDQVSFLGDVLSWTILKKGFTFEGERIPLVGPQGIFKPKYSTYPLSITTSRNSPYNDSLSPDGYLSYKYRGTDPYHRDNQGLSQVWHKSIPLVYFRGLSSNRYMVFWPVYVIGDDPKNLTFKIAVDDTVTTDNRPPTDPIFDEGRRAYITTLARQRLHQRSFREKVIYAYQQQCALCRIKHQELLDAAHIVPDKDPEGLPVVRNGISLCKSHHATFDAFMVGISPDYKVKIREDLLMEHNGPMLEHGIKELHNIQIVLPKHKFDWPDQELLERRYSLFKSY